MIDKYTNEELKLLNTLTDNLITWMFNRPNDRNVLLEMLKESFDEGKKANSKEDRV